MDKGHLIRFKDIGRRILVVDLALVVLAIGIWLVRRSLTAYYFGNALSITGLIVMGLGCLSLAGKWEFARPKHHGQTPSTNGLARFIHFVVDFLEANLVMSTLVISGGFAILIGEIVSLIFPMF